MQNDECGSTELAEVRMQNKERTSSATNPSTAFGTRDNFSGCLEVTWASPPWAVCSLPSTGTRLTPHERSVLQASPRHMDGCEVHLEIVGFWTPEYLAAKRETIRKFKHHRILPAIPKKTAKAGTAEAGMSIYGKKIDPDSVVKAAEGLRL